MEGIRGGMEPAVLNRDKGWGGDGNIRNLFSNKEKQPKGVVEGRRSEGVK